MRTAPFLLPLVLLSACHRPQGDPQAPTRTIDCALAGAQAFTPDCAVEQDGPVLVVHHKDGGFRRLKKVDDGRGVVSADGVEETRVQWIADGRLEVAVGHDRYRFPAKVKPDDAPRP
jgi:hypothetical protein